VTIGHLVRLNIEHTMKSLKNIVPGWKKKAQSAGSGVLLVMMDGMSQFSTKVPYYVRKDFGDSALGQHLVGAIVYSAAGMFAADSVQTCSKFAFLLYDHLTGVGGNATIEILMRLLKLLYGRLSDAALWPHTLVIIVDGASDNKYESVWLYVLHYFYFYYFIIGIVPSWLFVLCWWRLDGSMKFMLAFCPSDTHMEKWTSGSVSLTV
jgi:hypothetical protein